MKNLIFIFCLVFIRHYLVHSKRQKNVPCPLAHHLRENIFFFFFHNEHFPFVLLNIYSPRAAATEFSDDVLQQKQQQP